MMNVEQTLETTFKLNISELKTTNIILHSKVVKNGPMSQPLLE